MANKITLIQTDFPDEGVSVIHPITMRVKKLPLPEGIPDVPGVFERIRVVINLKVVDADQESSLINIFDPAIELHVHFLQDDLDRAKEKELRLALWDGAHWLVLTGSQHQFQRIIHKTDKYLGHGRVKIAEWGDPTVAWGT